MDEKDLTEPLFTASDATHASAEQLEGGESEGKEAQPQKIKSSGGNNEPSGAQLPR